MNRKDLIKLRNNIEVYLQKLERDDKVANMDKNIINAQTEALNGIYDGLARKLDELNYSLDARERDNIDLDPLIEPLENLAIMFEKNKPIDKSDEIISAISNIRFPEVNFPKSVSVDNFPPQRIPQPVTNININGLRGPVKSTAVTVGSTATPLPTSPLDNRRSLIVWNNDNSTTLWIGGEDVTVGNGVPVKKQNYSPALDLSDVVTLYGITDGPDIDVRVLENSMTDVGA